RETSPSRLEAGRPPQIAEMPRCVIAAIRQLTQGGRSDIPPNPVPRSYFIHTFGCQMNESDSQRMGEALARAGWAETGVPDGADLVLVNTCSIREKAEDKLFSALGRYRLLKSRRGTKIGVAGGVGQQGESGGLGRGALLAFCLAAAHH